MSLELFGVIYQLIRCNCGAETPSYMSYCGNCNISLELMLRDKRIHKYLIGDYEPVSIFEDGWYSYIDTRPPKHTLCQFWRYSPPNDERWVSDAEFNPAFNVVNLYWCLTGIGRMQMELRRGTKI